jgi:hypothetical protein
LHIRPSQVASCKLATDRHCARGFWPTHTSVATAPDAAMHVIEKCRFEEGSEAAISHDARAVSIVEFFRWVSRYRTLAEPDQLGPARLVSLANHVLRLLRRRPDATTALRQLRSRNAIRVCAGEANGPHEPQSSIKAIIRTVQRRMAKAVGSRSRCASGFARGTSTSRRLRPNQFLRHKQREPRRTSRLGTGSERQLKREGRRSSRRLLRAWSPHATSRWSCPAAAPSFR